MTEDIDKLRYIFLQDEEYQIFLKNPFDMLRGLKHQYKYPPQDYFEFAEAVQTAEIFMLVANE